MTPRPGLLAAGVVLSVFSRPTVGLTYSITVNDAGDTLHAPGCATTGIGTCTLRDAITYANSNGGADISFSPPGMKIQPTSALPVITQPVFVSHVLSILGSAVPELDGSLAGPVDGLVLDSSNSTIYSFSIRNFQGTGLVIRGSGNIIGGYVDCGGLRCFDHPTAVVVNGGHGIEILGSGNLVRYTSIGGNGGNGVYLHGSASGNTIGTDDVGPALVWYPPNSIGGNALAGIQVGDGRADTLTRGNALLANAIFGNGGLGIDLAGDGPTANDEGDADDGPNALQNFPEVCAASVRPGDGSVAVSGSATGRVNAQLSLRLFAGSTFLGKTTVSLGTAERAFFDVSFPPPLNGSWPDPLGPVVASATDQAGNTSELGGYVGGQVQGLSYYTVAPCRLVDTRLPGERALSGPRFLRLRGTCDVPATARAVVANVTVTNPTGPGHLSFSTTGCPPPTSTLNFSAGQTRANDASLSLDDSGRLTVWPAVAGGGSVDVILDVTGYWQ